MSSVTSATMTALAIFGVLVMFPVFISAGPGGEVSIMLHSYSNPGHKKYEQGRVHCCDLLCSGCDPYFNLCLKMRSHGSCHAQFRSRMYRNAPRNLVFKKGSYLGNGKSNPLTYKFNLWEGKIYLGIGVKDYDTITKDDQVDSYSYSTAVMPTPSTLRAWHRISLRGRVSTMSLSYSVRCNRDYYGPRCTKWCQPRDDFRGHYTCDNTGRKICKQGWYGPFCTISCTPSNDDVTGHYECDRATGNKRCLPGWYGVNCDTHCIPRHDANNGYICDRYGAKICLTNWYGAECDTYCKDNSNRYRCNKVTGQKECLQGWNGDNCDTKCMTIDNNNGSPSNYKCDGNGSLICNKNWYGKNCDTYCKPRDDDVIGHYTCDNQTGSKVCRPRWHGPNCTVYCSPQDDMNSGYTCNASSGERLCRPGWTGPNCDCFATDAMHAGYTCDGTSGQRLCLEGWTGVYCNVSMATPTPTATPCATPAEIGVLFDSSASVGAPNFLLMKYLIASLAEQVASSPPRFSIMRYNAWPILYLSFKDARKLTVQGLVRRVVELRYIPGPTRTDRALRAARTLFTKMNGGGIGNPRILIVLTDGKSKLDSKSYKPTLASLKAAGIQVIAVGVGGDVNMVDVKAIASDKKQNVFQLPHFRQLSRVLGKLARLIPCSGGQQPN